MPGSALVLRLDPWLTPACNDLSCLGTSLRIRDLTWFYASLLARDLHAGLGKSVYMGEFWSLQLPRHPLCVFMRTQHLLCQPFKDALCSLFSKLYLTLASFLVGMLYFPDLHLEKILGGAFCTELR